MPKEKKIVFGNDIFYLGLLGLVNDHGGVFINLKYYKNMMMANKNMKSKKANQLTAMW